MTNGGAMGAIERLENALRRLESAAARLQSSTLPDRHRQLQREVADAIAGLDRVIGAAETR